MESFHEDLAKKLGSGNLRRIESVKIGIAGAGGLGSNCAASLVRSGFRNLKIVDFDRIQPSNLDRQFYFEDQVGRSKVEALKENLERIRPGIEIEAVYLKIEKGDAERLFKDCDIVAECFDRAEYKTMIISELLAMGKFIVSASGLGGVGRSDEIKVHRMKSNLVVIGDLETDIETSPALSPRVAITAAKQADEILLNVINGNFQVK